MSVEKSAEATFRDWKLQLMDAGSTDVVRAIRDTAVFKVSDTANRVREGACSRKRGWFEIQVYARVVDLAEAVLDESDPLPAVPAVRGRVPVVQEGLAGLRLTRRGAWVRDFAVGALLLGGWFAAQVDWLGVAA